MIQNLWTTVFYEPLYNALIALTNAVPGGDIGIAIIILTVGVKLLLYPLSHKSVRTQAAMKLLEPEIQALREKHGKNREELARKTMELYKERQVNPFSGCLLILLQFPVILALYFVFLKGVGSGEGALYSFVSMPEVLNTHFLGLVDVHGKNIIIAILAAVAQFIQSSLLVSKSAPLEPGKTRSFQEEFARSMNIQMKYMIPVLIGFVAYATSAAVAIYFATSAIFGAAERLIVEYRMKKLKEVDGVIPSPR